MGFKEPPGLPVHHFSCVSGCHELQAVQDVASTRVGMVVIGCPKEARRGSQSKIGVRCQSPTHMLICVYIYIYISLYFSIYTQVQAEIYINASIHEHMKTCIHEKVGTCTP